MWQARLLDVKARDLHEFRAFLAEHTGAPEHAPTSLPPAARAADSRRPPPPRRAPSLASAPARIGCALAPRAREASHSALASRHARSSRGRRGQALPGPKHLGLGRGEAHVPLAGGHLPHAPQLCAPAPPTRASVAPAPRVKPDSLVRQVRHESAYSETGSTGHNCQTFASDFFALLSGQAQRDRTQLPTPCMNCGASHQTHARLTAAARYGALLDG